MVAGACTAVGGAYVLGGCTAAEKCWPASSSWTCTAHGFISNEWDGVATHVTCAGTVCAASDYNTTGTCCKAASCYASCTAVPTTCDELEAVTATGGCAATCQASDLGSWADYATWQASLCADDGTTAAEAATPNRKQKQRSRARRRRGRSRCEYVRRTAQA